MNLALIGYRGTGKSTVARQLALRLGWEWVDADVELELRAGKSITEIFADQGEEAFRDLETVILRELLPREKTVLALGGGVIVRPENRVAIRERGSATRVIWLTAAPETLWRRISRDRNSPQRRPALSNQSGLDEVRTMMAQREPWYAETADLRIEADSNTPGTVVRTIVEYLQATATD